MSPLFQKEAVAQKEATGGYALMSTDLDTTKKIRRVGIKVRQSNNAMCAMKLTDETGSNVVDLEWCHNDDAKWVIREIPTDSEIIGLYMSKDGNSEYIQSLGFVIWKPNPNAFE